MLVKLCWKSLYNYVHQKDLQIAALGHHRGEPGDCALSSILLGIVFFVLFFFFNLKKLEVEGKDIMEELKPAKTVIGGSWNLEN